MPKFTYVIQTPQSTKRVASADEAAMVMNSLTGQELFNGDMVRDYFVRRPQRGTINQFRPQFSLSREGRIRDTSYDDYPSRLGRVPQEEAAPGHADESEVIDTSDDEDPARGLMEEVLATLAKEKLDQQAGARPSTEVHKEKESKPREKEQHPAVPAVSVQQDVPTTDVSQCSDADLRDPLSSASKLETIEEEDSYQTEHSPSSPPVSPRKRVYRGSKYYESQLRQPVPDDVWWKAPITNETRFVSRIQRLWHTYKDKEGFP